MRQSKMLFRGTCTRIFVKEPGHSNEA